MTVLHGELQPRGLQYVPRSTSYDGRFGRLFRRLDPCPIYPLDVLDQMAALMRDETAAGGWSAAAPPQEGDNELIPAGYTYLGQFIDHDITFDPASSLTRANDPDALENFRTPRFDLDSVYGSGPHDEPFQYEPRTRPARLLLEQNGAGELDLPRNFREVALTGDPRNDENKIVGQLHLLFLQLHNYFLADVAATETALTSDQQFERAQQLTRWHYQWVIVDDFLRRICNHSVYESTWKRSDGSKRHDVTLRHYKAKKHAYMPVEFSVAAYRFGHSMIRATYDLNSSITGIPIFTRGDPGPTGDLRGGHRLPDQWSVDWNLFFDMGVGTPVQPSREIDTKLSTALFDLPQGGGNLARLNLERGQALRLPSGQAVAKLLRAPRVLGSSDLGGAPDPTPLWFYLLKESELEEGGKRLGYCGSIIVAETLLGLLYVDKYSFYNAEEIWTPQAILDGGSYGMPDLIRHTQS